MGRADQGGGRATARDKARAKTKNPRDRQQQYLKSHVDPCLKPLIRKCLRSAELPSDFRRWLYDSLRDGYGDRNAGEGPQHAAADFETTMRTLERSVSRMAEVFSVLNPAAYTLAIESLSGLRSHAAELKARYGQEHAREQARIRAEEEARKRAEEEAKKRAEAKRRAEEEAKKRSDKKTKQKSATDDEDRMMLFLSYARGSLTTPFARSVKKHLEANGFGVWMDEEGIAGGSDFMKAIGDAIKDSAGIVAIIDQKYPTSTYCENELVMAQSNGLQLFPILFREMAFESMPNGLQYMLASTNCVPFPSEAEDAQCLTRFLGSICDVFQLELPPKQQMRHTNKVGPATAVDTMDSLARVPLAVPQLPAQLCVREDIIFTLRDHLLHVGTDRETNKVVAHGQGGCGKTMVAAMIVNDRQVRQAFDRIGFISMGQIPNIVALQNSLFQQFTGTELAVEHKTAEIRLEQMQIACRGKRYLLVLDDIWEASQERLLNCIDESTGKLLVTTRIRKLLPAAAEVPLSLLTEAESIKLLLETGGVSSDEPSEAAAAKIAKILGYLPLYLSVIGGVIATYEGDSSWQMEVIGDLQRDRVGFIDEESGGTSVAIVVDTSLQTLSPFTRAVFTALGVCPEDVWVNSESALLICAADADVVAAGKVRPRALRKAVKALLDRNLLQGSFAQAGVKQHDMVRELVRGRIGDQMREKQKAVVRAFGKACPDNWAAGDPVGVYMAEALKVHMIEGLGPDPLTDAEANGWLDVKEEASHFFPRIAAAVFGRSRLMQMGESLEADGLCFKAAKRFYAAAYTDEPWGSHSFDSDNTAESVTEASVLQRAADLLSRTEQSAYTRSLEAIVLGVLILNTPWGSEEFTHINARLKQVLALGVEVKSPNALLGIARAEATSSFFLLGYFRASAYDAQNPEAQAAAIDGIFSKRILLALELTHRDDPEYVLYLWKALEPVSFPSLRQHARARQLSDQFAPLHRWREYIQLFDFNKHDRLIGSSTAYFNFPLAYVLLVHGEIRLARMWLLKMIEIYKNYHYSSRLSLTLATRIGSVIASHSIMKDAGLSDLALEFIKATSMTFTTAEATGKFVARTSRGGMAWETDEYVFNQPSFFVNQVKRRHFLLAPEEVGEESMLKFLASVPAEQGSSCHPSKIDVYPGIGIGWLAGGDCAECFEHFGRFEEAITAAETDIRNWQTNSILLTQSYTVLGRCQAKLGRVDEATAAFESAIDEAHRCELPFMGMLAIRDFIVCVLDGQGKRQSQMAALGRAISAMALPPSHYNDILGAGLDAEAAVAAFKKTKQ